MEQNTQMPTPAEVVQAGPAETQAVQQPAPAPAGAAPAEASPAKTPAAPAQTSAATAAKKIKKEKPRNTLLRILISLVVLALGVYLILFVVAKAGRFDSIGSMLQHMSVEVSLMWQRITS